MQQVLYMCFIGIIIWRCGDGARRIDVKRRMADKMMQFDRRSLEDTNISITDVLELHKGEDLKDVTSIKTTKGTTKTKLQETYKGIPVFGEVVVVEKNDKGQMTGDISGQLIEDIEEDLDSVIPKLTVQDALKIALDAAKLDANNVTFKEDMAELEIYDWQKGPEMKVSLVYILSFFVHSSKSPQRPYFVIDANTGEIVYRWQGLNNYALPKTHPISVTGYGGNERLGKHVFGSDFDKLNVSRKGCTKTCILENKYVRVVDVKHKNYWEDDDSPSYSFDCFDGNNDLSNGAYSPPNDVFFFATATFKMYQEWYDTVPVPLNVTARVHVGKDWVNAMWGSGIMYFGDGDSSWFPLVTHGVVAHEISHGFTGSNSGLIYSAQSGGINEAFSDMASEAIEYYLKNKADYLIGGGLQKQSDNPMRYMEHPEKDGHSIGHVDDFYDDMDVHLSSGIFNKAFSVLAKKSDWDPKKAFHVFLVANKIYWRENSKFQDAAEGVKNATSDLGFAETDVVDAFSKVGITI